jgi:hypothetical protein
MNERLLQFIWQFKHFNQSSLLTTDGNTLQILNGGSLNRDSGPDFSGAKIKIDDTTWVGNIELHVCASHWHQHKHAGDSNYGNIILHVVWMNDEDIFDSNHNKIPALELQSRVAKITLEHFNRLMQTADTIPCAFALPVLNEVGWLSWKERLIAERLHEKSNLITQWLATCTQNWEEVFWISLCRSFGMKVNADIFEQIAKTIPVTLLSKHKNQIHQLEALLLGQAGLLDEIFEDDYAVMLQKEYRFLSRKYKLQPVNKKPAFLRMRPSNFPTLRLAQLAMLVHQSNHLFSTIRSAKRANDILKCFDVTANDFWNYHYTLKDETAYQPKKPGKDFIRHIIINTIAPVLFTYGVLKNEEPVKEKALDFLMELEPEQNAVIAQWKKHGVTNQNALHSQALIFLTNNYCNKKLCLECAVGVKLLKE